MSIAESESPCRFMPSPQQQPAFHIIGFTAQPVFERRHRLVQSRRGGDVETAARVQLLHRDGPRERGDEGGESEAVAGAGTRARARAGARGADASARARGVRVSSGNGATERRIRKREHHTFRTKYLFILNGHLLQLVV